MHLLHLISSASTAGGGPIEAVRLLAEVHLRSGVTAELATLDDPATLANEPGFPIPINALGPGRSRYGYTPRLRTWLAANRERFDAAIVHGVWQYHSFAAWQALHGTPTPYFVFPHGMLDPWFKREFPLKHLKKWLYWPWADYRVLRDARGVLFTCEEERRLASESFWLYRAREIVTGLGTKSPDLDLNAARGLFLAAYPDLHNRRIALFMGRLHPKKGCDLLLEAFARTLARNPEWTLVMAGPDQVGWQAKLQSEAARLGITGRILWPGMLTGAEKWGALASAEVFVLPSHQENFGIAVAEALACGTPVLISRQVNIWREISGENAGLTATDDLHGTVALLQEWSDLLPEEQAAFRPRAQTCFRNHFEIERSATRVLDAIGALSHSGRKSLPPNL